MTEEVVDGTDEEALFGTGDDGGVMFGESSEVGLPATGGE